jgi:hypothetical protein
MQEKVMWLKERIFSRVISHVLDNKYNFNVFDEEWKTLVILDACRFDTFKEVNTTYSLFEGNLEYRYSCGGNTVEWLVNTFDNEKYDGDIVYITANPWVYRLCKGKFKIVNVWLDYWDEELGSVHPSSVVRQAIRYVIKKRCIVHFVQPHLPSLVDKEIDKHAWKHKPTNEVYVAYRYNLLRVLLWVKKLLKYCKGRVVITSDHGEAFGEWVHPLLPLRVYSHPYLNPNDYKGHVIDSIRKVPWLVV